MLISKMAKVSSIQVHQIIEESKQYLITAPERTLAMLTPILERIDKQEITNPQDIFNAYNNYGSACFVATRIDEAITYFNKALTHVQANMPNDKYNTVKIYHSLGLAYANLNALETSLEYYFMALQIDIPELKPNLLNNIAFVYSANFDYKRALSYFELAVIEAEEQGNDELKAGSLLNAASSLIEFRQFDFARTKLDEAFSLLGGSLKDTPNAIPMSVHAHTHLARIFCKSGDNDNAAKNFGIAIDIAEKKVKQVRLICISKGYKAIAYLEHEMLEEGLQLAEEVLVLSKEHKLNTIRAYLLENIVANLERIGKHDKAYKYMKLQLEDTKETLHSSRNANFWKILNQQEKSIQASLSISEEHNAFVEQLTHILSHDLKEPIRNIASFSDLISKRYGTQLDEEGKEFVQFISSGANQMSRNLVRLLEYTTLKTIEHVEKIDLLALLSSITEQYTTEQPELKLSVDCTPNATLTMNKEHAVILFDELIANAIKFRKEGQECNISIQVDAQRNLSHIKVKDSGLGIDAMYHNRVFKIFNKLNRDARGEGMGLAICERIVQLYNGRIWVVSEPKVFTEFHFTIPTVK